jgi:prepilin-type N-terminal cleavage/methylation domain-containing protein
MVSMHATKGFTLSEILICLAILGVILGISIPLLAMNRQKEQKKTVFKETIQVLMEITRGGMADDELLPENFTKYYFDRMNAIRHCPVDATAQGCWTAPAFAESTAPGVVLLNGSVIIGMDTVSKPYPPPLALFYDRGVLSNGVLIDWNGAKGPNLVGDDQLYVDICYGPQPCEGEPHQPGTIVPYNPAVTGSNANNPVLFKQIFD